jgi:diaminohydroxyphosphoribosylaminopyrimidine deaminase/5-amino-6-(5-phosphoribosylamino)uracil reductase
LSADEDLMRRAIALAARQVGRTGDNPAVGCVIVKNNAVIGEGATGGGGRPHAEEIALEAAGEEAGGATVYVSLEPCAERSSGGLSCSQRLVAAGVARVVIACDDPSALAAGHGAKRLAQAGVVVEAGLLRDEALTLYEHYAPRK